MKVQENFKKPDLIINYKNMIPHYTQRYGYIKMCIQEAALKALGC